ncbi:MAG TPA: type II secretion system F family protein [Dehalococcoidia bacterium]|nr:type II secretion system F family protein [Dehalococcoidia bacterium]
MLFVIGLTSFITVVLAVFALGWRPAGLLQARIDAVGRGSGVFSAVPVPFANGPRVAPLTREAIDFLRWLLPQRWYAKIERSLISAGRPLDPGLFLLLWAVVAFGGIVLGFLLHGVIGALFLGLPIAFMPFLWLRNAVGRRRARIGGSLASAADLLVACVESGLGLEAALIKVGEAIEGPLGQELRLTLAQISIGRPRAEALLDLGARTGVPDLDGFIRPIVQSERAGVSIGSALRVQAETLREIRRQRVREFIAKLPAKMVIPMIGFFLPTIMLVGIAPAVFKFIDIFSKFHF